MIYVKLERTEGAKYRVTAYAATGAPTGFAEGAREEMQELVEDLTDLSAALVSARRRARWIRSGSGEFAIKNAKLR